MGNKEASVPLIAPSHAAAPNFVQLQDDEAALFGYGSLFCAASMERSLGRRYVAPFVICSLDGWRRAWDVAMPNGVFYTETASGRVYPQLIVYLNVHPARATQLNGVLFVIKKQEMDLFDRREWIYDRVDITAQVRGVHVSGGKAYVYVGKPEHLLSEATSIAQAAIRRTYLEILETGFNELGQTFREDYERSTQQIPTHLVIDDHKD